MATEWATVASTRRRSTMVEDSRTLGEPAPVHKSSRPQEVLVDRRHTIAVANPSRLDQETEELRHGKLSRELGILIQKGRQGKGWSQRELAMKINEKPQVIAEYEAGRGVKNNVIIAKIETLLGVKIRDKK